MHSHIRSDRPHRLLRGLGFIALVGLAAVALAAGNIRKVNGSITIRSGEAYGDVTTVNGSVRLQDGARADTAETVNGSITLGAGAQVEKARTVNGSIRLGENARVQGNVESVNGAITALPGVQVGGDLGNVNGTITLDGVHVAGQLGTSNGSILIGRASVVEGGLLMREPKGTYDTRRVPRVVIGPEVEVRGTLRFERPVELYVHDSARIGPVEGATERRFSGSEPPAD